MRRETLILLAGLALAGAGRGADLPAAASCAPRAKGWSVATLNGAPGLYRDGKPVAPVLFWQWKIEEQDAKAMSRGAGVDLFGVFGSFPHYANPYWKP